MGSFTPLIWWVAPIGSIVALIFAFFYYKNVMQYSEGTDKMKEIAGHVKEGAMAYLSLGIDTPFSILIYPCLDNLSPLAILV